jgi:ketopantoate hydroxymethyltransferase
MQRAIEQYAEEVRNGSFPTKEQSFQMNREALAGLAAARS